MTITQATHAKAKDATSATGAWSDTCETLGRPSEAAGKQAVPEAGCLGTGTGAGRGLQPASCSSRLLSRRVTWHCLQTPSSSSPSASCSALGIPRSLLFT